MQVALNSAGNFQRPERFNLAQAEAAENYSPEPSAAHCPAPESHFEGAAARPSDPAHRIHSLAEFSPSVPIGGPSGWYHRVAPATDRSPRPTRPKNSLEFGDA